MGGRLRRIRAGCRSWLELLRAGYAGPSPAVQRTLRGFQDTIFARLDGLGGGTDEREVPFQSRAVAGPEFENGHPAPAEILLIAEVLVGKNEEGEPGCFSGGK